MSTVKKLSQFATASSLDGLFLMLTDSTGAGKKAANPLEAVALNVSVDSVNNMTKTGFYTVSSNTKDLPTGANAWGVMIVLKRYNNPFQILIVQNGIYLRWYVDSKFSAWKKAAFTNV